MAYTEDVNVNLNVLAGAMGGITAIMGGMSALTSTFGQFGTEAVSNFGAIDGLLVTTTALIASFGVQAADAFGEFEQGMKIVQTVSGQSAFAIQQLGDQANQLSVKYRTAINDITDGLQTLGRAGLNSAETQLDVLESGLQTAKLEGRNLNSVLEELIQNTAMLGGDLKSIDFGDQSEYLNSLLVGTSMTAPIDSHDISQTLQYAGGTAAAAGANLEDKEKLEDLMGTVAAFAQKGVKGSMAGTALRAFFTKPASQDQSVVDALGSIGLSPDSLWENGGESMKKVSDQIAIINSRMKALHMSTMDQVELWGKIVGPKMGQQMMKLEASSIRELTTDIQGAQSAQELAAQTLETYNQKVNELGQQGQLAFRELGEQAVQILTPIVDVLNMIMKALSNPVINRGVFYAFLGLITNGVRTAWGMIKSVGSQIMDLIRNTEQAVANLAQGITPFSDGLSTSASRAELLNSKLAETNAHMQAIQGSLLGINKTSWFANGANPLEKVERGVISSAAQNVFIGGKTEGGIQFGEDGKIYSAEEAVRMKQEIYNQSKLRGEIEENIAAKEARLAEIDTTLTRRQSILDKANNLDTRPGNRFASISSVQAWIEKEKGNLAAARERTPNPRAEVLKRMEEAGVSEQDVVRLIHEDGNEQTQINNKKRELNKELDRLKRQYVRLQQSLVEETVMIRGTRTKDARGDVIENPSGYLRKVPEKAERDFDLAVADYYRPKNQKEGHTFYSKTTPEYEASNGAYEELIAEVQKILNELRNIEKQESTQQPVNPKAADFVEDYQKAGENHPSTIRFDRINEREMELNNLEAEIASVDEENILKLKTELESERAQILAELEQERIQIASMPESGLQMKEITSQIKTLETELNARMVMMEEYMYKGQMEILKGRAKSGDEIAKFAYKHNQELEKLGVLDLGNGYKQMYLPKDTNLTKYQQDEKFMSTFATKSQAAGRSVTATIRGFSNSALSSIKQQGIIGASRTMFDHFKNKGEDYNAGLDEKLRSVGPALDQFRSSLQTAIKGIDTIRPKINQSIASSTMGMKLAGENFGTIISSVSGKLGIAEQQLMTLMATEVGEEAVISSTIARRIAQNMVEEQGMRLSDLDLATRERLIAVIQKELVTRSKSAIEVGGATSTMGKAKGALSSIVGYMGGPFMVAMMGATEAMRLIQESQSKWQERMNEASNKFSEASDKLASAEENIANLLRDENSSISDAQIEQFTDAQKAAMGEAYEKYGANAPFSKMYASEIQVVGTPELTDEQKEYQEQRKEEGKGEDKTLMPNEEAMDSLEESAETLSLTNEDNLTALEENTVALRAATYAYIQAEDAKQKEFTDKIWGWLGEGTKISDGKGGILGAAHPLASLLSAYNDVMDRWHRADNGFFDTNSPVLSSSMSDKNYAGSTEFAGVLAAYMKQEEDARRPIDSDEQVFERALQDFFGNDYDQIISLMGNMDKKMDGSGLQALQSYNKVFGQMSPEAASRAQLMFKDNKPELQKLGKQMFRYEQQYGFERSAYDDFYNLKRGIKPQSKRDDLQNTYNNVVKSNNKKDLTKMTKDLKKLTQTDRNLLNTVRNFMNMSKGLLTEQNVLAMGSLQQLQDMYQVANEQVAPGIMQTVQGVYDTVAQTSIAAGNAGSASDGAFSASSNAAAIAAFLGAQATDAAYTKAYQAAIANGDAKNELTGEAMSKETFIQKINDGTLKNAGMYQEDVINTLRGSGLSVNHPDYTPDQIEKRTKEITGPLVQDIKDGKVSLKDGINTVLHPLLEYAQGATMAAYENSKIGEYGSGTSGNGGGGGGGGGGGDGGGSSDKDNSGTRKERVDLVLCNKKEIPKLNVNLFKKPPNFTVLNKNFKVRDIKINSQDKPKAIMNAVKNGIIETQKRMDPKIIQDEESVYDPVAASDGKSTTPSGTTKTTSEKTTN